MENDVALINNLIKKTKKEKFYKIEKQTHYENVIGK